MGLSAEILLADASVLIDYVETDVEVLCLASRLFAKLLVPRPVLEQVPRLTYRACRTLGIVVVDAETEILVDAATRSQSLGFEDSLCLVLCEQSQWTCVTNDAALARVCARSNVAVRRGLNLMVELVAHQRLTTARAVTIAHAIQASNHFVTAAIVAEFERLVYSAAAR